MKDLLTVLLLAGLLTAGVLQIGALAQNSGLTEIELRTFSSHEELKQFLVEKARFSSYESFGSTSFESRAIQETSVAQAPVPAAGSAGQTAGVDYSKTNIQVEGVDEADIVKSDGRYIYVVSGQDIHIVEAYPTDQAKVISKISLDGQAQEIFVNDDRLIVFGNIFSYDRTFPTPIEGSEKVVASLPPPRYRSPRAFVQIYDITDREEPAVASEIEIVGSYFDSRMIGDWIYVIVNTPIGDPEEPELPVVDIDGSVTTVKAEEIGYFDILDQSYRFTTILAVNVEDDETERKTVLMGQTQTLYVSEENIYSVYPRRLDTLDVIGDIVEALLPELPPRVAGEIRQLQSISDKQERLDRIGEILNDYFSTLSFEESERIRERLEARMTDIMRKMEQTIVHKIAIDEGKIEYSGGGWVPGTVLNQFSMDEFEGNLRIATTNQFGSEAENNVYVLDEELDIIGRLEGLAPGERIFSARFLGEKAYLVTFRQVDPLFVIDLSNPKSPSVLGKLKIPGFSDYLHPYDANHIIGVGREIDEKTGWDLGVKLGLFDVSDPSNPIEVAKFVVGEGSDSEALRDHKAFLFSREKNLLVIPIEMWRFVVEPFPVVGDLVGDLLPPPAPFNGAYVFDLSADDGFELRGKIAHESEDYYLSPVRRSLYIEDVLYTISETTIKMNGLEDLDEIGSVDLFD